MATNGSVAIPQFILFCLFISFFLLLNRLNFSIAFKVKIKLSRTILSQNKILKDSIFLVHHILPDKQLKQSFHSIAWHLIYNSENFNFSVSPILSSTYLPNRKYFSLFMFYIFLLTRVISMAKMFKKHNNCIIEIQ